MDRSSLFVVYLELAYLKSRFSFSFVGLIPFLAVPRQLGFKAEACQSYSGSILSLDEHATFGPYFHPQ